MHFLQANSLLTQTAAQGLRCFLGGQIPRICHPVSALNLEVRILPISLLNCFWVYTPGPHLMRIHLVRYSTSTRYEKYSNIHLVRPIIQLLRIFALSTS